jgi:hypothetical protein
MGKSQKAVLGSEQKDYGTSLTSPYGKDRPEAIPTMPPYISLFYCKKIS